MLKYVSQGECECVCVCVQPGSDITARTVHSAHSMEGYLQTSS